MKTETFKLGDTVVNTDELPKAIRGSIDFFDQMNNDLIDVKYRQNILIVAIATIRAKIQNDILQYLQSNNQTDAGEESVNDVAN